MVNQRHARLDINGLSVVFGQTRAVDAVDLHIAPGEVLAVLGPSGCGKSTLLRAIAGLADPTSGTVLIDGVDQRGIPAHRRGCVLLFQDGQLFDHRTVAENVAYALKLKRIGREQVRQRVTELLELVGLSGFGDRAPATLSGGERQRVALARALAAEPQLLLLDEPLSALDRKLRAQLAADVARIVREAGITTVVVTHDHDEAFSLADTVALMRKGRIVQNGRIVDVWAEPADDWAAEFLGYDMVFSGDAASAIAAAAHVDLKAAGKLAARAAAFVTDAGGPMRAIVRDAQRMSPTAVLLELDLGEPIGPVTGAVGRGESAPAAGTEVRISLDSAQLAPIG